LVNQLFLEQEKMAGELSFLTTPEVEVAVAVGVVVAVEGVVVVLVVLT
jgi:hypothetical protein